MMEQCKIDADLFSLTLECARPSWRFRAMFSAQERQIIQASINTLMGIRQRNFMLEELGQQGYGPIHVVDDCCEQKIEE